MSDPELPNLKKKERERKKAGAFWTWGSRSNSFSGATGGSGAVARSAASAIAAASAPTAARLAIGRVVLMAGVAMVVGGSGLAAYSFFGATGPAAGPALGAIASSVRPHKSAASASLENLTRAAAGEIKFDADKPPPPAEPAEQAPAPEPQAPKEENFKRPEHMTDRLAHNLSGAKLSTSLGGQFGTKNVFSNPDAPRFGQNFDTTQLSRNTQPLKGGVKTRGAAQARALSGRSRRAMGQLKFAKFMSGNANRPTSGEASSTMATNAFDQNISVGGAPPSSPLDGAGTTPTGAAGILGTGAPDVIGPPDVTGVNTTPYQSLLNNAYNYAAQAGQMKQMATMLLVGGIALIAAGAALTGTVWGAVIGRILMAIGALLMGISGMMYMMSNMMAAQARRTADMIQQQYNQQAQGDIIRECTDQAIANGTQPEQCRPTTQAPDMTTTIRPDAQAESESTYQIEGGGPIP